MGLSRLDNLLPAECCGMALGGRDAGTNCVCMFGKCTFLHQDDCVLVGMRDKVI